MRQGLDIISSVKFFRKKLSFKGQQSLLESYILFQVAGELSNAGQPMRRFMQTFILAPQSPKKYYVHNNIFRYQDEVFHDVITDSEPDASGEFLRYRNRTFLPSFFVLRMTNA